MLKLLQPLSCEGLACCFVSLLEFSHLVSFSHCLFIVVSIVVVISLISLSIPLPVIPILVCGQLFT